VLVPDGVRLIEPAVRDRVLEPPVERVALWDRAGRLIYQSGLPRPGTGSESLPEVSLSSPSHEIVPGPSGRQLRVLKPILWAGSSVGALEVEQDFEPLATHILEMQAFAAASVISFSLVLYLLLFRLVRGAARNLALEAEENAQLYQEVRESERRFRSLVQNASDLIAVLGQDGTIQYVSPSIDRVLGYDPQHLTGSNLFDLIHPEETERARTIFSERPGDESGRSAHELSVRHRDGSWRQVEAIGSRLLDDPSAGAMVINAWDITERKVLEEQLRHQAFFDPLTDLPNRALFMDRLTHALARADRDHDTLAGRP
jgi:PAS domain S-box-containing protein